MKIAVIGGGAAGVCAGKHCSKENFSFDIFEQTGNVGGTWNYTDRIGVDEHGIPVHSSMYKGLRTNLPKELMSLEDFSYPPGETSFITQEEVLDYINNYTKHFDLFSHVKFYKQVLKVNPQNDLWLVEYEDVRTKEKHFDLYNAIIVCNGHYKDPFIPQIPGLENFSGAFKHSHNYRSPECYKNKRVLVIGAGPSGLDISQQIVTQACRVYLSHKVENELPLSLHINQKPVVVKFIGNKVLFEDGTEEEIDEILFCTGYCYTFPFLTDSCGVEVEENYVHPLYKHVINIENPTMAFIGLIIQICPFPLFDIQIRFFLSTLTGHFKLPPKEKMLEDLNLELSKKSNIPMRKYHLVGDKQGEYFDDLATTARIKKVPPVISKLFMRVRMNRNLEDCFRIVDDDNWEQIR